ncbi:secondary thiamine-phosphate synthase enzyme [Desulfofundulus thermosubterraneus DSM 16057]|uniref:Secondary thiamine-phosphate synthase enzyme n=2 Tax=Desulfofundulus TaxID=2282741 RepID=A0A1M6L7W2_9FIRM|nr:secondary thiamine-phosphate synthase enzyme YjbQ [Desulfofundulus thermosubterraneus]SHJ67272.1 secondary thiamine-phosphate synthase enzyme [Desulfofundulus thermosubterraneus DSM 16057]
MMIHTLTVNTTTRSQLVDITSQVRKIVQTEKITEGCCHLFVPHTTAGITINEHADPSVAYDILSELDRLVPREGNYRHLEGNADAHIKASLVGSSLTVLVTGGQLVLGTWQGIFFCEFDGPRQRKVLVKVVAD